MAKVVLDAEEVTRVLLEHINKTYGVKTLPDGLQLVIKSPGVKEKVVHGEYVSAHARVKSWADEPKRTVPRHG